MQLPQQQPNTKLEQEKKKTGGSEGPCESTPTFSLQRKNFFKS